MEAKDTVMDDGELDIVANDRRAQIERQAEVSFKAGRDSILAEAKAGEISVNDLVQSAKQEGRKELFERIKGMVYGLTYIKDIPKQLKANALKEMDKIEIELGKPN